MCAVYQSYTLPMSSNKSETSMWLIKVLRAQILQFLWIVHTNLSTDGTAKLLTNQFPPSTLFSFQSWTSPARAAMPDRWLKQTNTDDDRNKLAGEPCENFSPNQLPSIVIKASERTPSSYYYPINRLRAAATSFLFLPGLRVDKLLLCTYKATTWY